MRWKLRSLVIGMSMVLTGAAMAQHSATQAKDIVLDRVNTALTQQVNVPSGDAMVVSVLLESVDGSLMPRAVDGAFNTGDRFRVKVLASRAGKVALYNTKPNGVLTPTPIWRGDVRVGRETITPRLAINGDSGSGVDQLHVVLEPASETNLITWLGTQTDGRKDIRLDQQSTPDATYMLTASNSGLVATLRIAHR